LSADCRIVAESHGSPFEQRADAVRSAGIQRFTRMAQQQPNVSPCTARQHDTVVRRRMAKRFRNGSARKTNASTQRVVMHQ